MIDVAALRAAGLTDEQIVKVIEADQNERKARRREQNRIAQQNHRSRKRITDDSQHKHADACQHVSDDTLTPVSSPASPSSSPLTLPLITTPSPTPSQKTSRARGSRLPVDWMPSLIDQQFAIDRGLSGPQIQEEGEKFRDYWHARAGPGGVKLDWAATWRTWCRNVIGSGNGGKGPQNGRGKQNITDLAFELADEIRERERAVSVGRPPSTFGSG